jgi:hypothetical protein
MKLHRGELSQIPSNKDQLCSHEDYILFQNELSQEIMRYG